MFIENFILAAKDVSPGLTVMQFHVQTAVGPVALGQDLPLPNLPSWEPFAAKAAIFKNRDFLDVRSVTFNTSDGWRLLYADSSSEGPHITLFVEPENVERAARIADALNKHFTLIPRSEFASLHLPTEQLEALKFAERTISSFATEAAKLSQAGVKSIEEYARLIREKTLELEDRFRGKENEIEQKYAAKFQQLEQRESAHAEQVKLFDLRNNTVVRRDLLREIRTKIDTQKTMEVSPATSRKRYIIHAICLITLFLSCLAAGSFLYKFFVATQFDWRFLVPISTGALVFVSTFIFYIKWNDQWFRDHARVEFENRKFAADVLRASWIAELLFEWEHKKGTIMPLELIERFTKNLFESAGEDSRLHPFDQLSDLLKHVSSVKLSKSGFEVTKEDAK